MAVKYISCTKSGTGSVSYRIAATYTQDAEALTTTVSFMGQLKFNASYGTYDSSATTISFSVNGSAHNRTNKSWNNPTSWTNVWTSAYTQTFTHGSDGKLAPIAVRMSYNSDTSRLGTVTCNATLSIPDIYVGTVPSFSAASVDMGTPVTITLDAKDASYTHNITYSFVGLSDQTNGLSQSTGATGSVTFTPPVSLASQIPQSDNALCTITVVTLDSSDNEVGSVTSTITLTVPESVVPTIQGITLGSVDRYIQGASTVSVTEIDEQGAYGSSIDEYTIQVGSFEPVTQSSPQYTSPVLDIAGEVSISVSVSDTRGRVSSVFTETITVLAYEAPYITSANVVRYLDSAYTDESEEGSYVRITVVGGASSVGGTNTASATVTDGTTTQTIQGNADGTLNGQADFSNISADQTQTFVVTITDTVGNSTSQEVYAQGAKPWIDLNDAGSGGVAIDGLSSVPGAFDVHSDSIIFRNLNGLLVANGNNPLTATSIDDLLGFQPGDEVEFTFDGAGYVTSSKTLVRFALPINKPISSNVTNITASSIDGFIIRQNGYKFGSSATAWASPTSYSVETARGGGLFLDIFATFTADASVVNNDIVGIEWSGKITFS